MLVLDANILIRAVPGSKVGITYSDALKGVDVFYSHPENLQFGVVDAIYVFCMRANGKSRSEIDRFLQAMRSQLDPTVPAIPKP